MSERELDSNAPAPMEFLQFDPAQDFRLLLIALAISLVNLTLQKRADARSGA